MNDFDWVGSYSDFLAGQAEQAKASDWRERLRLAVDLSGKKHSTIAWEAGITRATLSRVLTGAHSSPQFETVVRIAHAAGEHVGWILREPRAPLSGEDTKRIRAIAAFLKERFP